MAPEACRSPFSADCSLLSRRGELGEGCILANSDWLARPNQSIFAGVSLIDWNLQLWVMKGILAEANDGGIGEGIHGEIQADACKAGRVPV